jgi:hypothetical protein
MTPSDKTTFANIIMIYYQVQAIPVISNRFLTIKSSRMLKTRLFNICFTKTLKQKTKSPGSFAQKVRLDFGRRVSFLLDRRKSEIGIPCSINSDH